MSSRFLVRTAFGGGQRAPSAATMANTLVSSTRQVGQVPGLLTALQALAARFNALGA